MLIFDSKYPGYGKQKPKQWGPISVVRAAVFRNAEAMGIDPSKILLYSPFWGRDNNIRDIISGEVIANSVPVVNDSLVFTSSLHFFQVPDFLSGLTSVSVTISLSDAATSIGSDCAIMGGFGGGDAQLLWWEDSGYDNTEAYLNTGSAYKIEPSSQSLSLSSVRRSVVYDGESLSLYAGVDMTDTMAASGTIAINTNSLPFGRDRDGYRAFYGTMYDVFASSEGFSHEQISIINDIPYAFLEQNPTPLIFDWGAIDTTLILDDALHSLYSDNLALSQNHNITAADSSHAHVAESLALLQQHILSLSDSTHGHTADNLTLLQQHLIAILDAAHDHTADNLSLTQNHNISANDSLHDHAAENLTLAQIHNLAVADGLHSHTADNITIILGALVLAIAGATHDHTADNLTLSQVHQLAIAEAVHAHTADNLTLNLSLVLAIADALHSQNADSITLTQQHILAADDALHSLLSDDLALLQDHNINIAEAFHSQTADNLTLYLHGQGLGIISDTTVIHLTPQRGKLILTVERSAKHV